MFVVEGSLEVRPAVPADGPAIHHLLTHTPRPAVHAWPWEEHLGEEVFLVTLSHGRLVGALLAWPDAGPAAWVRLGVLGSGIGVGPWLDRTLPPLLGPLRRRGARMLAWMDVGGWAGPALKARRFAPLTRLVTMVKKSRWIPSRAVEGGRLRPGAAADIPTLTRLDHAAFSPPWWLSGETLERLRRGSACFLVAERGDELLGYVEARLVEHGAHIGRLAVDPRAQGQGIGGFLLAGAISRLWERGVERVTLNTQEENLASRRLYTRFGFHPVGRRVVAWERRV
ncbi:MAG TPA: GNAT family N-acetyltransferase [Anaerolineales bacterium]|nr:GNAT family N-acetyltransferase [Anaerolineae bacterium]HIQ01234.1 GNAT family N-acetyltransferase [Anaerolineales bacterium]